MILVPIFAVYEIAKADGNTLKEVRHFYIILFIYLYIIHVIICLLIDLFTCISVYLYTI